MPGSTLSQRVSDNVRAEMARANQTQSMLAPQIDMQQQALSRRLAGHTPFTIDELGRIASALSVPLAALVAGTEDRTTEAAAC